MTAAPAASNAKTSARWPSAATSPVRLSWPRLLKRVFEIDFAHCPNCGGELKIIAAILATLVVERIVGHCR